MGMSPAGMMVRLAGPVHLSLFDLSCKTLFICSKSGTVARFPTVRGVIR